MTWNLRLVVAVKKVQKYLLHKMVNAVQAVGRGRGVDGDWGATAAWVRCSWSTLLLPLR